MIAPKEEEQSSSFPSLHTRVSSRPTDDDLKTEGEDGGQCLALDTMHLHERQVRRDLSQSSACTLEVDSCSLLGGLTDDGINITQLITAELVNGDILSLYRIQSRAVLEVERGRRSLVMKTPSGPGNIHTAAVMAARVDITRKVLMCAVTNSVVKELAEAFLSMKMSEGKRAVRFVSWFALFRMKPEHKSSLDIDEFIPRIMDELQSRSEAPRTHRQVAARFMELLSSLEALDEEVSKSCGPRRASVVKQYHSASQKFRGHLFDVRKLAMEEYNANVLLMTVDSAISSNVNDVDVLIIADASQITDKQLLMLLEHGPEATIVLIGEPVKLNPYPHTDGQEHPTLHLEEECGKYSVYQ